MAGNASRSSSPIKDIGIDFGTNLKECNFLNLNNKIEQCKNINDNWE